MKKSRFSEEQIIAVLKEHQAGIAVADLCRKHGISEAMFYNWKAKYGGLEASDIKRLKELERENTELKKMLADPNVTKLFHFARFDVAVMKDGSLLISDDFAGALYRVTYTAP